MKHGYKNESHPPDCNVLCFNLKTNKLQNLFLIIRKIFYKKNSYTTKNYVLINLNYFINIFI